MEFLLIDIGATLVALVGYAAIVFWEDVSRDKALVRFSPDPKGTPADRMVR